MSQLIEYASPAAVMKRDRNPLACLGFGVLTCMAIATAEFLGFVFTMCLQQGSYGGLEYVSVFGLFFVSLAIVPGLFYGLPLFFYEVRRRRRIRFTRTLLPTCLISLLAGGLSFEIVDRYYWSYFLLIVVLLVAAPALFGMIHSLLSSVPAVWIPVGSLRPKAQQMQSE